MSSTTQFKVFKETALPSSLQPNSIYLVAPASSQEYVEMYVTTQDGRARRHLNEADVKRILSQFIASKAKLTVVDSIANRDQITDAPEGSEVYVKDASADNTVNSGGARYLRVGQRWVKISETESMDISLSWDGLRDKPNATPANIDLAVQHKHTHQNKTQLDKLGEDGTGNLTYGGQPVKIGWSAIGW